MRPPMTRTFHHEDFAVERLARLKEHQEHTVSVCLPARDEAANVADVVSVLREVADTTGLVDEVLVVDDHSGDDTAGVARRAGARVVHVGDVLPELGPGEGKGEALWTSLVASEGDLVVWVDADITDFEPRFVIGLLGPLLTRPEVGFVKGFYDRPLSDTGEGGGRVTELVARPLIATMFPRLRSIVQPLAGEYAGRRSVLERMPFVQGYGVDLALLVDISEADGIDSIAQVDLGTRRHRNRPIHQLGAQALAVMQTALRRAGTGYGEVPATLVQPGREPVVVDVAERPALVTVPSYRRRSA